MKKGIFLIATVCLFIASCGLKGKMRAWAQKNCECRELKGTDRKNCKAELREMELSLREEMASLSDEERKELHAYEEEIEDCPK